MPDFKYQNLQCTIQHLQSFDQLLIRAKNEEIRVNFSRHLWPEPSGRTKGITYKIIYPVMGDLVNRDMSKLDSLIWSVAEEAKRIFFAGPQKWIHPKNRPD